MEEPKKVLKAQYLGSTEVNQPTGMDVLNVAIETILNNTKPEQWDNVNVAVAPSMISINSSEVSILLFATSLNIDWSKYIYAFKIIIENFDFF